MQVLKESYIPLRKEMKPVWLFFLKILGGVNHLLNWRILRRQELQIPGWILLLGETLFSAVRQKGAILP